jgi:hypothetical protein
VCSTFVDVKNQWVFFFFFFPNHNFCNFLEKKEKLAKLWKFYFKKYKLQYNFSLFLSLFGGGKVCHFFQYHEIEKKNPNVNGLISKLDYLWH